MFGNKVAKDIIIGGIGFVVGSLIGSDAKKYFRKLAKKAAVWLEQYAEDTVSESNVPNETDPLNTLQEAAPIRTDFTGADYKGVMISGKGRSREAIIDALIDKIISSKGCDMSEEEIEAEVEYLLVGNLQRIKYESFGNPEVRISDVDVDSMKTDIREDVIRDAKVDKLIKTVIAEENITATADELEEEAKRIAESQGSTMDMIKRFFGEDLSGLQGDVIRRKAQDFIYDNAVIE